MFSVSLIPLVSLLLLVAPTPEADIDAFWAEAVRTVVEGDYEGYAALYHDDAVLVNGISGQVYPIADALERWRQGFVDTAEGRSVASLEFRFTKRLHHETTAHETGLFRYSGGPIGEDAEPVVIHFESLLVKDADGWKWVMEYQTAMGTEAEWEAAAP